MAAFRSPLFLLGISEGAIIAATVGFRGPLPSWAGAFAFDTNFVAHSLDAPLSLALTGSVGLAGALTEEGGEAVEHALGASTLALSGQLGLSAAQLLYRHGHELGFTSLALNGVLGIFGVALGGTRVFTSVISYSGYATTIPVLDMGDKIRILATFTDSDTGVLADPSSVVFRLRAPGGIVTTNTPVSHQTVGVYFVDLTAPTFGKWRFKFEAAGVVAEGQFTVRSTLAD